MSVVGVPGILAGVLLQPRFGKSFSTPLQRLRTGPLFNTGLGVSEPGVDEAVAVPGLSVSGLSLPRNVCPVESKWTLTGRLGGSIVGGAKGKVESSE